MSSTYTTVLITGANRGIGQALLATYLARPSHTVIAAVREPQHPAARALESLPKHSTSKLIIVKIDSGLENDGATAIQTLSHGPHNITALDIVIANAGIAKSFPSIAQAKPADLDEHYRINARGPLFLFQATLPLMNESKKTPKFITIGSSAGSIGGMERQPIPNAVYGPSKAMVNWLMRKMHFENEGLVVFPMHPGWVQTEMGNQGAVTLGFEKAEISVDESINGMMKVIDNATRETTGGRFMDYNGQEDIW